MHGTNMKLIVYGFVLNFNCSVDSNAYYENLKPSFSHIWCVLDRESLL